MSLNCSPKDGKSQDFLCGPGVKRLHGPKAERGCGSILGQETKILKDTRPKKKKKNSKVGYNTNKCGKFKLLL